MMMYCSLSDCTCNEFSSFSFFSQSYRYSHLLRLALIQDSVSPASQSCDNHMTIMLSVNTAGYGDCRNWNANVSCVNQL